MMDDAPNIQHKATFKGESDFAYEDGELVPFVGHASDEELPPDDSSGAMVTPQFIDSMMRGANSLDEIGARLVLTSFGQPKCLYRPKSLRELALWLNCSHPTAKKLFTTFLTEIARDFDV
jgi:hypothetical protein